MKMAQCPNCAFPNEKPRRHKPVLSPQDFYDYADEHFGWAETARTERERAIFFQMAAAWLEVAQRWEASARLRATQLGDGLPLVRRGPAHC